MCKPSESVVISVAHEYLGGDDPCWVTRHIDRIGGRLAEIFELADRRACGTQAVADKLAHEILDRPALSSEPPEALQLAQTS